jgi:signal transduction histidine kinase
LTQAQNANAPADLGRRWHSTGFRWLSVYALIFAVSVMSLVGYIGWSATGVVERDTDIVMRWQLSYFDSIDDALLPDTIRERLEDERMHSNYFGLFNENGQYLAGDIRAVPPDLPLDGRGHTLDRTLALTAHQPSPVVRAMAMRRANGQQLIIARDLTHVLRIRETTISGLIGGGIFCLVVTLVTGFLLSLGQMRRVADIRRVTLQIANGDLNQRLPTGGRDELDMLTHLVNHMLAEVERLMHEVRSACDGIAHDLRTPLAHIRTLLGHISERGDGVLDEQTRQLIDRARGETNSLLERFRAMLRISEIGALKRRGGFAALNLQELLVELCELYEPLAEVRSLQWRVHAEPIDEIHGDRALLFETFSNLLDNAIKFTPEGGEVRIAWTSTPAGPQVVISDSGPGIPASERAIVLQRFYRGEQTNHLAGSGLGLSIVSAVLRVHDFALRIDSAEPGATMTIECWPHTLE